MGITLPSNPNFKVKKMPLKHKFIFSAIFLIMVLTPMAVLSYYFADMLMMIALKDVI